MPLAVAPEACPEELVANVEALHSSLKTLLIAKKIPWAVMAKLGEEGYVTMEDLGDRWNTPQEARDQGPRKLEFAAGPNIPQAEVRHAKACAQNGAASPLLAPGPAPSKQLEGGLDALRDGKQLLADWDTKVKMPRPKLETQGSDSLLKRQFKLCAKGEVGWIQMKHIVSALPEVDERPLKTRRKILLDGWEREEEEEERKKPTTKEQLKRAHLASRTNLMMCLIAFPQFSKFNLTFQDLEDWYAWFWGS